MSKFLFVSFDALASDLAWQVKKQGHQVKFFIKNKECQDIANGLVDKVTDWESEIAWADIVVFDDVMGMGKMADKVRKQGKLVVGGTPYTDRLEDDRSFGQEELKKLGINIIPYQNFTDFEAAIDFVKKNPGRYVVKPSGEIAISSRRFLFVGEEEDGRDIIQILTAYKQLWSKKIKLFQLQKRITGVEMAVGAFFNGHDFVLPININFENKKLFPGNIGPSTGEMGTHMFWSQPNKIFNSTLKKFEDILRTEKYVGYIDLNCIVNSSGIYPLEFTTRFGYPCIHIQQEGIAMPISEFLYKLADGSLKNFKTKSGFQIGVRLVIPPYPYRGSEVMPASPDAPDTIILFKKPNFDGVHIEEVRQDNDQWVVANGYGTVLVVTGSGPTMHQARHQTYKRIQNILIPNMYYRDDIGNRWFEDSDRLHNWGYLREI